MSGLTTGQLILIIILCVLLLAVVFLTVRAFYEPYVLKITTRKMFPAAKCPDFRKQEHSAGSSEKPGIRLFFFSDLHADICLIKPERLISAIKDANASSPLDAVLFGGDICNNYRVNEKGLTYLRKISEACRELGIPFYGVTGNHDFTFEPSEETCGFECIENKQIRMTSRSTASGTMFPPFLPTVSPCLRSTIRIPYCTSRKAITLISCSAATSMQAR